MPTPQEKSLFVEQASCLFLRIVQDVSFTKTYTRGVKNPVSVSISLRESDDFSEKRGFLHGV